MTPGSTAPPSARPRVAPRVLPPDEWDKLAGVEGLEYPLDLMKADPGSVIVVVVEDEGKIVASWIAMNTVHLEGLHVRPEGRGNPLVARAILLGMVTALRDAHIASVLTIAPTPEIKRLAETGGFQEIPGTLFRLDL